MFSTVHCNTFFLVLFYVLQSHKVAQFLQETGCFGIFSPMTPFEMVIFVQCCPMFFFSKGGSIIMYYQRKSSPFQRWCCFQGQAVHGIPTGGCTLDPLTVRLFLREKKIRFPQDGAATCMVLVRTSDIYRNAKGTVDYIYLYIWCVYWYLHDSMTNTFLAGNSTAVFTKLWLWHNVIPAETGLALCEPSINHSPMHFFIAQRWNR